MAIADNLVAWYDMDEASGTRYDSTASNLDLTDVNTVGTMAGKYGNAAYAVKANNEKLTNTSFTNINAGSWTIASWVYLHEVTAWQRFFVLSQGTTGILMPSYISSTQLYIEMKDSSSTIKIDRPAGLFLTIDQWDFFTIHYDASTRKISMSVNGGALYTSAAALTGTQYTMSALYLNANEFGSTNLFTSGWDGFGVWERVLLSEERTWLYNAGAGRQYSDLVPATGSGGIFASSIFHSAIHGRTLTR